MKARTQGYASLMASYLRPQWRRVLLLAGLVFGSIGLDLFNPQVMRRFLDGVQASGPMAGLLRLAALFIALALAQQFVAVLATVFGEGIGWTATNALRADLAEHCLRLDPGTLNAFTPGEMIERIDGDVTTLANLFSRFAVQVLGGVLLLAGVLALLWREDWRLGLALGGFALANLFVLARLQGTGEPLFGAERQASADLYGFLEERLAGAEDIRANGLEGHALRRFVELMRRQMRAALRAAVVMSVTFSGSAFLFSLGTAVAFAVSACLFQHRAVTLGTVYLVFQYTNMLRQPIDLLSHQLQDLQKAGAGAARVLELLRIKGRLVESNPAEVPGLGGPLAVAFQGVSFSYEDALAPGRMGDGGSQAEGEAPAGPEPQAALSDVSFALPAGEVMGVLGRTGSGKTTLARLLFRFYDPPAGAVCLGDASGPLVDIRGVPLDRLRCRVGLVTQSIHLFQASVRDNLTFFDPAVPDERIRETLAGLGLGEWVDTLPAGLDTVLEGGGAGLSAGQAQLLAFARVFLRDPGLVVFDEASSRLDPASEHMIERAVDRLLGGGRRTAIVIAHRLSTVQRAGRIMILEDGHVAEYGPRTALAADPASRFHHLLQTGLEEVLA